MLHGLENELSPGPEAVGAPDMDDSLAPLTLRDAIDATRNGDILKTYFGEQFISLFTDHREGELESFERFISQRELDWYL